MHLYQFENVLLADSLVSFQIMSYDGLHLHLQWLIDRGYYTLSIKYEDTA